MRRSSSTGSPLGPVQRRRAAWANRVVLQVEVAEVVEVGAVGQFAHRLVVEARVVQVQ
jgi:hypothetical protein